MRNHKINKVELHLKVIAGLERLGEVFKTLLWQKAKVHGISPIQIQILLFISSHRLALCNVSYLAKEFNVTKPTISDAVKVLLKKDYLVKDYSPTDNRRYNVLLSSAGEKLVQELLDYRLPVATETQTISEAELKNCFDTISKLIYQLNQKGIIQVQRTCFGCQHYQGDKAATHFCTLLDKHLMKHEIRLDCADFSKS